MAYLLFTKMIEDVFVNTFKKILLVVTFGLLATTAMAEEKIVILDMQAAMMGTDVAKKSLDALRKDAGFTALQAKVESYVADINALQASAEKNSVTWSEEQLADHRKKVEYLRADYELAGKKLQSEQQAVLQRVQQELTPKVRPVLEALIKEQKIGLVLNAQTAFHADQAYDITPELIKRLNAAK